MISLKIIKFFYDTKQILNESNFIAYPKQLTILTGESGAGKSTLLSILACLHEGNFEGNYSIDEKEMTEINRQEMIFYVTQNPSFIYDLTIYDNFIFFLEAHGRSVDKEEIYDLANKLNMEDKLKLYPKQLSGGEKQKAAIILALCSKMKVILFDEPTASLDGDSILEVIDLLKERNEYLIVSSHDERLVEIADRHYHIEDKKIHLIKGIETNEVANKKNEMDIQKKSLFDLSFILMKQIKYKGLRKFFILILLTVCITGLCLSFYIGNKWYNDFYLRNQELSGYKTLVFKADDESVNTFSNQTYLTSDSLEKIYSMKNYINIMPYYRFFYGNLVILENNTLETSWAITELRDGIYKRVPTHLGDITCLDKNGMVKGEPLGFTGDNDNSEIENYYFSTYHEDKDYSMFDIEIFGNEGFYVDKSIANYLNIEKGDSLKVSLFIPQYFVIDESNNVQGNSLVGEYVDVIMPVRGVVHELRDLEVNALWEDTIYIPFQYYDNLIEEHKKNNVVYIDTYELIPYTPNVFFLEAESDQQFKQLLLEIDENGFSYKTGYFNMELNLEMLKSNRNESKMIMGCLLIVVLLILFVNQYYRKKEVKEKMDVLKIIGFNRKERVLLLGFSKLPDFLISLIISIGLLPIFIVYFSNDFLQNAIVMETNMIIMIVLLTFLVIVIYDTVLNMLFE